MALHDYRRMIDLYGGGYIAVEITTENTIELDADNGIDDGTVLRIDKATAGVLLDAIAGAIRELEGLKLAPRVILENSDLSIAAMALDSMIDRAAYDWEIQAIPAASALRERIEQAGA